MLLAHRAVRNAQRHFRLVPASPACAPRPRCARQRAVGRGERSNRFFHKTGSEPSLRWIDSKHSIFFSKNLKRPSPSVTSTRITLRGYSSAHIRHFEKKRDAYRTARRKESGIRAKDVPSSAHGTLERATRKPRKNAEVSGSKLKRYAERQ